jgi:Xaa-Pro dipeptidase
VTAPDGAERRERIRAALASRGIDAVLCTLPSNVLLLSGYWPVVGTAVTVATAQGDVAVVAPEDEADLVTLGWASHVRHYRPGSLESLAGPAEAIIPCIAEMRRDLGLESSVLGIEVGPIYEQASYSASFRFQSAMPAALRKACPTARQTSADEVLRELRASLTQPEVERVRLACRLAGHAFEVAREAIVPGAREPEVATAVSGTTERHGVPLAGVKRAGAFAWCMAGSRSAQAGGAFALTGDSEINWGEVVLVHSNPYVDGYFADVTRTYVVGPPSEQLEQMYTAIFAAREAALSCIRDGAWAVDVDRAARDVIERAGFGRYFTHGLGHNVGFSAISADFPPRLHPASTDALTVGSTFNVEPVIYIPDFAGIRHCDVVTVTPDGYELLTPFHDSIAACIVASEPPV